MVQIRAGFEFSKPANRLAGQAKHLGIPLRVARLRGSFGRQREFIRGAGTINSVSAYIQRILCEETSLELHDVDIKLIGPKNNPTTIEHAKSIEISFNILTPPDIKIRLSDHVSSSQSQDNKTFGTFLFHPASAESLDNIGMLPRWGIRNWIGKFSYSYNYRDAIPVRISLPIHGIWDRNKGPFCLKLSLEYNSIHEGVSQSSTRSRIEVDLPIPYESNCSISSENLRMLGRAILGFFAVTPLALASDLRDLNMADINSVSKIRWSLMQLPEKTLMEVFEKSLEDDDSKVISRLLDALAFVNEDKVDKLIDRSNVPRLAQIFKLLHKEESLHILKAVSLLLEEIGYVRDALELLREDLEEADFNKLVLALNHYLADDKHDFSHS